VNRFIAALLLALGLVWSPAAVAQEQTLNYQNADIRAVVQDISRVTGRTFIVDPSVQGAVTVVSNQPLSRAQVIDVFVATLRANGLVVSQTSSGAYRISPAEGAASLPSAAGVVTEVFQLRTVDAAAAAEVLRPLVSPVGQILPDTRNNTLTIADYSDNLRRIRGILAQIDQDRSTVQTVALSNTSATEIAEVIRDVLGLASGDQGGSAILSVTPVASSNAIVLRGDPDVIARAQSLIAELDARAAAAGDIRVVHLQHASAEQLLPVLQQLVGQQPTVTATATEGSEGAAPSGPAAGLGGGAVSIARYPGANALIIAASPEIQRTLGEVIRQLDTRRQQVLVEAIIVEVSDNAAQQLGVQFLLGGGDNGQIPFIATNYSNSAPSLMAITGALIADDELPEDSALLEDLRDAAISSLIGATGVTAGFGGQNDDGALFGFILNAIRRDTASNLLSTPSVMTLDNAEARFLGGQEVPVSTGEALGQDFDNPFRTIERRDVGVQLDVTPQINAGGGITLQLRVEVSSVAGPISEDYQELIFNKREVTTTVLADDGEIIVLGGLLDQNERISTQGIPYLEDIPGLGALFRSNGREAQRTNLMIFLRPTIIRSAEDAARASARPYEALTNQQRLNDPENLSSLDALVRQYMQATPPGERPPSPAILVDPVTGQALPPVPAQ
jgi:general secretion pathway protein D